MSKNLKLLVFAGAAIVMLSFGALMIFSDGDEGNSPPPLTAAQTQPALLVLPPSPVVTPLPGELPVPTTEGTGTPNSPAGRTTAPKPVEQPKQPSAPGQVVSYEIQSGDMVSKIASKYGCKRKDIYDLNEGLNDQTATRLQVGQKIKVPDMRGIGGNTKDGGNTANISNKTSDSTPTVSTPTPPQAPEPPALTGSRTHKLKLGDNIFALATYYYGSPVHFRLIRSANPDWDCTPANSESVGRELVIPALKGEGKSTVSNESTSTSHNPIPSRG
ncbi:MAG: LysM peptidoglycan-binding domain-containing protein [Planctomycetes bacterium]|nr:LysM peptidoglycan-binding domain-containing protein [Planctomycetota bacterium]NUQ34117.1 LysM peptidoglycan-binding domain-containing protein [Planctomycetaceae bacterium]